MRNPKAGVDLSELEALVHGRYGTGTTFVELGRELGVSATYVSSVYQVAVRKLAAQAQRRAGRRINFLSRR